MAVFRMSLLFVLRLIYETVCVLRNLVRKCEKVKKQLNYAFGPKGKERIIPFDTLYFMLCMMV